MKLSVLGVSAWFAVVTVASVAHADVGPISPARRICMGQPEGAPCTIDGKAGACQGPHPSRMYCTPGAKADVPTPAAEGSGSATGSNGGSATGSAPGSNGGSATGSNTNATSSGSGSSQAADNALPLQPAKPPRKSGCAATAPAGAASIALIGVILGAGRAARRRRLR